MHARPLLVVPAAAALTLLSGCIISVNDSCDHCTTGDGDAYAAPAPGNYTGAIRAAQTITYSSDRCSTLSAIAARPDIDEPSQLTLIRSLCGSWGYSGDKTRVLETLIANPALTQQSSMMIANNLGHIAAYSSDRKKIADMLASRPMPPAPPAPLDR